MRAPLRRMFPREGEESPLPADVANRTSFSVKDRTAERSACVRRLYGGFAGWETALEEHDWQTNETILSVITEDVKAHGTVYITGCDFLDNRGVPDLLEMLANWGE